MKYLSILFLATLIGSASAADETIKLTKSDSAVKVEIGGQPFTTYLFGKERTKPVLYPIAGPGGKHMVRDYPFKKDRVGEAHDHPHHESLWYTHGSVNGISFWHVGDKTGSIRHREFIAAADDEIAAENDWIDHEGKIVCSDTTRIKFFATPDGGRGIDYQVTLHASNGDVTFGDTKEGSMGIRTHPALRLSGEVATGQAINNDGLRDKTLWGKPAKWLYYWGQIDGDTVGIGIFDHPSNPRHPTTWHARHYGLIAANPFGHHDFMKKEKGAGDMLIKNGESVTFRYAFVFLNGDPDQSKVTEIYKTWSTKGS